MAGKKSSSGFDFAKAAARSRQFNAQTNMAQTMTTRIQQADQARRADEARERQDARRRHEAEQHRLAEAQREREEEELRLAEEQRQREEEEERLRQEEELRDVQLTFNAFREKLLSQVEEMREKMREDEDSREELFGNEEKVVEALFAKFDINRATLTCAVSRNAHGEVKCQLNGIASDVTDLAVLEPFVEYCKSKNEIADFEQQISPKKLSQFIKPVSKVFDPNCRSPYPAALHGRLGLCAGAGIGPGETATTTFTRSQAGYIEINIVGATLDDPQQPIDETVRVNLQSLQEDGLNDHELAYINLKNNAAGEETAPEASAGVEQVGDEAAPDSSDLGSLFGGGSEPGATEQALDDEVFGDELDKEIAEDDADDALTSKPEVSEPVLDDEILDDELNKELFEDDDDDLFNESDNKQPTVPQKQQGTKRKAEDDVPATAPVAKKSRTTPSGQSQKKGPAASLPTPAASDKSRTPSEAPQAHKPTNPPLALPTKPSEELLEQNRLQNAERERKRQEAEELARIKAMRKHTTEGDLIPTNAEMKLAVQPPKYAGFSKWELGNVRGYCRHHNQKSAGNKVALMKIITKFIKAYGHALDDEYGAVPPTTQSMLPEEPKTFIQPASKNGPPVKVGKEAKPKVEVYVPTEVEMAKAFEDKNLKLFKAKEKAKFLNKYSGAGTVPSNDKVAHLNDCIYGWYTSDYNTESGKDKRKEAYAEAARQIEAEDAAEAAKQAAQTTMTASSTDNMEAPLDVSSLIFWEENQKPKKGDSKKNTPHQAWIEDGKKAIRAAQNQQIHHRPQNAGIQKRSNKKPSSGVNHARVAAAYQTNMPPSGVIQQQHEAIDLTGDEDSAPPQQQSMSRMASAWTNNTMLPAQQTMTAGNIPHTPAYQPLNTYPYADDGHYRPQSPTMMMSQDLYGPSPQVMPNLAQAMAPPVYEAPQVMQAPVPAGVAHMPGYQEMRSAPANQRGATRSLSHTNNASLGRVRSGGIHKTSRQSPRSRASQSHNVIELEADAAPLQQQQPAGELSFDDFANENAGNFANAFAMGQDAPHTGFSMDEDASRLTEAGNVFTNYNNNAGGHVPMAPAPGFDTYGAFGGDGGIMNMAHPQPTDMMTFNYDLLNDGTSFMPPPPPPSQN